MMSLNSMIYRLYKKHFCLYSTFFYIFGYVFLFSGGLLLQAGSRPATAPKYPLEAFIAASDRREATISPDGQNIAYLERWENHYNLFVQDVQMREPPRQLTADHVNDIHSYFWKNSDRIIYGHDSQGDEKIRFVSISLREGVARYLTPKGARAFLLNSLKNSEDQVVIGDTRRDARVLDVYRINVATGETERIAKNPGNIYSWVVDNAGEVRGALQYDRDNIRHFLFRDNHQAPFQPFLTNKGNDWFAPVGFTADNQKIYAISNLGRDKKALVLFNLRTGQEESILYHNKEVDVSEKVLFSSKNLRLLSVHYEAEKPQNVFFDLEIQKIHRTLARKFSGYVVELMMSDESEKKWIVKAYNERAHRVYLFDSSGNTLKKLIDSDLPITEKEMARMGAIRYKARDGLLLKGYLTLPKGQSKQLPLILYVHGGPIMRDVWGYRPEVQFLANNGYAVLQINYRGSSGYGRNFEELGFRQWGRAMQNDLTDGVRWAIAQGVADPKRVAIVGESYGGYAALAGATFTPELYAAAVSFSGPYNLVTFLKNLPPHVEMARGALNQMIGDPVRDRDYLEEVSPALHADKIRAPLFLVHGGNDPRVSRKEAEHMREVLQRQGKSAEIRFLPQEGHGLKDPKNQLEIYREVLVFLDKQLGLSTPTASSAPPH